VYLRILVVEGGESSEMCVRGLMQKQVCKNW
jgi:hypothetical protein